MANKKFNGLLSAYKGLKPLRERMDSLRGRGLLSAYKGLKLEYDGLNYNFGTSLLSAYKGLKRGGEEKQSFSMIKVY